MGRLTCTDHECSSTCTFTGYNHVKTFDGQQYDFDVAGTECAYTLVKVGSRKWAVCTKVTPATACVQKACLQVSANTTVNFRTPSFHQTNDLCVSNVHVFNFVLILA